MSGEIHVQISNSTYVKQPVQIFQLSTLHEFKNIIKYIYNYCSPSHGVDLLLVKAQFRL